MASPNEEKQTCSTKGFFKYLIKFLPSPGLYFNQANFSHKQLIHMTEELNETMLNQCLTTISCQKLCRCQDLHPRPFDSIASLFSCVAIFVVLSSHPLIQPMWTQSRIYQSLYASKEQPFNCLTNKLPQWAQANTSLNF